MEGKGFFLGNDTKSNVVLIRDYFESGRHGRKVAMAELKALSKEDRQELADLIRAHK